MDKIANGCSRAQTRNLFPLPRLGIKMNDMDLCVAYMVLFRGYHSLEVQGNRKSEDLSLFRHTGGYA